jgi:hypothetical protein
MMELARAGGVTLGTTDATSVVCLENDLSAVVMAAVNAAARWT